MVNRHTHPKFVDSLLVLMALAVPSAAVWGGAPQSVRTQDAEPVFPEWCLLPRPPLLQTAEARSQKSEAGSYNGPRIEDHGQAAINSRSRKAEKIDNGYDALRATDQEPALVIPSTAVWESVSQAMTTLRAEPAFPSLLPRTPLSPALWTDDTQPVAEPTEDQAAGSAQVPIALAVPSAAVWGGAPQSVRTQDAEPAFPEWCLLPRPPLLQTAEARSQRITTLRVVTRAGNSGSETGSSSGPGIEDHGQAAINNQSLKAGEIDNGYDGPRTTDHGPARTEEQGPPLAMASTLVWGRVLQALGIQDAELRFPSFLPQSPFSSAVLAAEGEKEQREKRDRGQTTVATLGVQSGAQGYKGLGTTDDAQTPIDNRQSEIDNPYNAAEGEKEQREKRDRGQTTVATLGVQSGAQGYNALGTTDHAQTPIDNRQSKIDNPSRGRALRDPFKLPPPPRPEQEEKDDPKLAGNRPPGARGLVIEQLRLKGVVRDSTTHKMIAVVTNSSNRAYFLREGEAVYDGVVSKITSDAVYFKGSLLDAKREVRSHAVVKTLSPAPGEVR